MSRFFPSGVMRPSRFGASSGTCLADLYTGPVAITRFNPAQGFQSLLDSRLAALQACNDISNSVLDHQILILQ
jgi:hypothetical protein